MRLLILQPSCQGMILDVVSPAHTLEHSGYINQQRCPMAQSVETLASLQMLYFESSGAARAGHMAIGDFR